MWILYIVSTVADFTEPKVTRYAEFNSLESCYQAEMELEKQFTQGEWTLCDNE
jgi:hypothetical protein